MDDNFLDALRSFDLATAIIVCLAYAVTDGLYARYTLDVAHYHATKAASIGALIHFFIAFGVINYTQNWLYIFPLVVGSWIGTYGMVSRERRNHKGI